MTALDSTTKTYEVVHTVITVVSAATGADAEAIARRELEASGVDPFSIVEDADSIEVSATAGWERQR
jgi:hypothetical protein